MCDPQVALGRGREDLASVIWECYLREGSTGNPVRRIRRGYRRTLLLTIVVMLPLLLRGLQKASSAPKLYRIPTNVTLPDHYHCYLSEESPCALRLTGSPYSELVGMLQNVSDSLSTVLVICMCFLTFKRIADV